VLQGVLEKIQFQRLLGDLLLQQRDASLGPAPRLSPASPCSRKMQTHWCSNVSRIA
jgi:hypothetical protein